MRRRGGRGGRARAVAPRLADRLRDLKELGLRDLSPLERPEGTPETIDLASALRFGERSAVIVASRRDGLDLPTWGRVAQLLSDRQPVDEVIVAAPAFGRATRAVARAAAERGLPLRLVTAPLLAEHPEQVLAEDDLLSNAAVEAAGSLAERLLHVVQGAAALTGAGVVQRFGPVTLLYLRGLHVLRVQPEGDGLAVSFLAPEKRHVHVTESSFARWGLELHESVISLAQDPRLLGAPEEQAELSAERAAERAGARITGRWIPWNDAGGEPLDWVGVDAEGRAVAGVVRSAVGLADVPSIVAGLEAARSGGAAGLPRGAESWRLLLSTEQLDSRARALLESLDIRVESQAIETAPAAVDSEQRGSRRRRGRRRGRRDEEPFAAREEREAEPEEERALEAEAGPAAEVEEEEERVGRSGRPPRRGRRRGRGRDEREPEREEIVAADRSEEDEAAEPRAGEPEFLEASTSDAEPEIRARDDAPSEPAPEPGDDETEAPEEAPEAAASAPEPAEEAEEGEEPAAEEPPVEPPRRRRARAAICVSDDPEAILAALVLARDRRHIPFFHVCPQAELMDFFRGRATDLDDNSDLLLVGFTTAPIARETIATAELFRGRIQWFDAHEWAVEDAEALRDAIGRDSVVLVEGASGPLAAVIEACERRSRFTDKMVDLSARRLAEGDMQKWGYRLIGLIEKLSASTGDHRTAISAVLQGKPAELPEVEVYVEEESWLEANDPRIVHFGEYQMAVVSVPANLDAAEVGRRARLKTGARLSLARREGDSLLVLGANDEKRHVNLAGVVGRIDADLAWVHARNGGDRSGRLAIDDLSEHPERVEAVIGEIARHKSVLYG